MVDQNRASWNRVNSWLRQIDRLGQAACQILLVSTTAGILIPNHR
jgi:hypothetical protein